MRKLKLQMQISLDGFVTMEYGGTNFNWDNEVRSFSIENVVNVDNILLGRNTGENFIPYWAEVARNPTDSDYKFGKLLTEIPKTIFSNKLLLSKHPSLRLGRGGSSWEIRPAADLTALIEESERRRKG